MENPRAIVHPETQHEAALMTEETGLLEDLPYEFPPPSDHHSDNQFATCSVSITYSYEGPAEKSDHLQNDVHPTTKPSPKVHPYGDIDGLNPLEGDAVHPRHIQPTPSHQKPIPLPAPSQRNSCDTPSSSTRAHRRHMGANLDDPAHQNAPETPDCLNDPDRAGMSCTSVYLGLHQFSPHRNCALAWSHPQIH